MDCGITVKQPTKPFALCIDNTDYKASLIPGKVYRIIPDPKAAKDDFVRIVDESGKVKITFGDASAEIEMPK